MDYTNREQVMKAVTNDGWLLYNTPTFQTDREIVMLAVTNDGYALKYAPAFHHIIIFMLKIKLEAHVTKIKYMICPK